MKKKKILSLLLTLAMAILIVPMSISAANDTVEYLFSKENLTGTGRFLAGGEVSDYDPIDSTHKPTDWDSGWYVVRDVVTINDQVSVDGPVHLILTDGCELTCEKGILVETTTASLTIYAQSTGDNMGKLTAKGKAGCAGIGTSTGLVYTDTCGPITIHGGRIWAEGGNFAAGIGGGTRSDGGKVTVYGGDIYACGDGGAGIGGGGPKEMDFDDEGEETLVIGSGGDGGEFSIYGGFVWASGSTYAAGIGGGRKGNGGKVNLYGGKLYVSAAYGCAFGRGAEGTDDGSITVGEGLALFDGYGKRINGGFEPKSWKDYLCQSHGLYIIVAPSVDPETYQAYNPKNGMVETKQCSGYTYITGNIKTWTNGWYVVDNSGTFDDAVTVTGSVNLIIENGKTLEALGGIRVEDGASLSVYTQSDGENQGALIVSAPENTAGIGGGNGKGSGAFTVHGGSITVTGGANAAAIGGGKNGNGGTFTIYGGMVNAEAGTGAARAIGAGTGSSTNGTIVVRGGYELLDLTTEQRISRAAGENWADKQNGAEMSFTITPVEIPEQDAVTYRFYNDDMVLTEKECTRYRILDESEQVLLDGWYVAAGNLNFSYLTAVGEVHLILTDGSTVTVKQGFHVNEENSLVIYDQPDVVGQSNVKGKLDSSIESSEKRNSPAAGIGGDTDNNCGSVTIHGGTIIAEGGNDSAGIGGGRNGSGGTVTVYGGSITATGSTTAAGIGGGSGHGCDSITINGGNVTAVAPLYGAGIGSARNGSGGTVTINGGMVTANSTTSGTGIGNGADGKNVDVTITGGTVIATGGSDALVRGDSAGINAATLTVCGGTVDAINGDDFDAIFAEKVVVSPKDTMCIHVKSENGSDLNGSPFEEETDITAKISGHDAIYFEEIEHDHDFTGEYRDNGDGTHSRKCTKCSKYDTESTEHIYENYKCVCGAVEPHTHDFTGEYRGNGNGTHSRKCTKCDEWGATAEHDTYTNTYSWDINNNSCTVTRTCDTCGEVIFNEYSKTISVLEEMPGKDCKTMGRKSYRAVFENAEPAEITVDTVYGPHPDADDNGWCDLCGEFCVERCSPVRGADTLVSGKWILNTNISFDTPLTIQGDVTLYLADGCTLTANKGIILTEGNSLTINAQSSSKNIGKIIAKGRIGCAGIGGYTDTLNDEIFHAGTLVINGGDITATGGVGAAGIGDGLGAAGIGGGAALTIGDAMAVYDADNHLVTLSEGGSLGNLLNSMNDVRIVGMLQTIPLSSIRIDGEKSGIRFAAYVTDKVREVCTSYGFIVARQNEKLYNNPALLTFDKDNSATGTNGNGIYYTSGAAYINDKSVDHIYATNGRIFGEAYNFNANFFTGVVTGIPDTHYSENLVARPYVIVNGATLYGKPYADNIYDIAVRLKAKTAAFDELQPEEQETIKDIISAGCEG